MTENKVDAQVITSLVVHRPDEAVLFVRYDSDEERWWLPGGDVEPYTHPDDSARKLLADMPGLRASEPRLSHVESFRGRRGWHLVFHYDVRAEGEPRTSIPAEWFARSEMPRTVHGSWEKKAVTHVLEAAQAPS